MVAHADTIRLTLPVALSGAVAGGLAVAAVCLMLPVELIEAAVVSSGLRALIPAAEPLLGFTARLMLAAAGGLLLWAALSLLVWRRKLRVPGRRGSDALVVRRADAHPDAPPRPPILADRDLGTPFLEVTAPVERDLPVDLSASLADYDPGAIPPVPRAPVRLPAPLAPGERIETFALTPGATPGIDALLDRLEGGARTRRTPPLPHATIEEALGSLRGLASRA